MVITNKTITVKMLRGEQKATTQVGKVLSLLPNDYRNLINLPTINGVQVSGELNAKELSLLSSNLEDYNKHELEIDNNDGKYFIVVGEDQLTAKVPVETVAKTLSLIKTTAELDNDMDVGSYRFVEKKR